MIRLDLREQMGRVSHGRQHREWPVHALFHCAGKIISDSYMGVAQGELLKWHDAVRMAGWLRSTLTASRFQFAERTASRGHTRYCVFDVMFS
jgi:hypothetical protein